MIHDLGNQMTHTSASVRGRRPAAVHIALALALVVLGIAIGVGGVLASRILGRKSLTEMAIGTWTCNRSGGGEGDRPIRAKVFISSDTWALVELNKTAIGGREFSAGMREGGTWRLTDGRLEIHSTGGSSGANFTIEEVPQDLSTNKVLVAKEAYGFTEVGEDEPRDSSVSYNDGVLTLRWEEYTFRCSKDSAPD
ncbi:hypothetical protein ABZ570_31535 [Micromonospora sp. NPDC007271]|uniref:hypothetical protein n=1 Tax=Micromonospora sp. NPDC007271 TaxID=3154587 RepID=UPI0033CA5357